MQVEMLAVLNMVKADTSPSCDQSISKSTLFFFPIFIFWKHSPIISHLNCLSPNNWQIGFSCAKNTHTSVTPSRLPRDFFFCRAVFFPATSLLRVMDPILSFKFFHIPEFRVQFLQPPPPLANPSWTASVAVSSRTDSSRHGASPGQVRGKTESSYRSLSFSPIFKPSRALNHRQFDLQEGSVRQPCPSAMEVSRGIIFVGPQLLIFGRKIENYWR